MSYSRWAGHEWYIYWDCKSDDETRDGQYLAVWHVDDQKHPLYSYRILKDDRESVWNDINSRVKAGERERFDECIDWFIEDVEESEELK